ARCTGIRLAEWKSYPDHPVAARRFSGDASAASAREAEGLSGSSRTKKKLQGGVMGRFFTALFIMLLPSLAVAQTYPERPITIVVPFSAGGPTDTVTRLVADAMSKDLGQQIVVENVTGAGGTLGAGRVAKAAPDGYTLLLHHIGMATSATLYRKLAYKPLEAVEYGGVVTEVPMVIVGRKDLEPKDLRSLIEYVKANKDKVTYAHAGVGAASHLCGMLFMS